MLSTAATSSTAVAIRALDLVEENVEAQRRQWELQLEQARYETRVDEIDRSRDRKSDDD
jgi:hypothetical protein